MSLGDGVKLEWIKIPVIDLSIVGAWRGVYQAPTGATFRKQRETSFQRSSVAKYPLSAYTSVYHRKDQRARCRDRCTNRSDLDLISS